MRWLIDTNILVSAALFPNSVPAKAFERAVSPPGQAVIATILWRNYGVFSTRNSPTSYLNTSDSWR